MLRQILIILSLIMVVHSAYLEISHTYPSFNRVNNWKMYRIELTENSNVMLLPDQLLGYCEGTKFELCKKSLRNIPTDIVIAEFDGFDYKFSIGLADSGLVAIDVGSELYFTGVWKSIQPPYLVVNTPETECSQSQE